MSTDNLEPIRRVFRNAGLYHHASDDLLCQELAAVAAPQPQAEPVGEWVMVPREPTEAMLAYAEACWEKWQNGNVVDHIWQDMLAAAPQPQASPQAEDAQTQAFWDGYDSAMRLFDAPRPQPRPQASAEDVRRVGEYMVVCLDEEAHAAWQRIRASLGVANG